MENVKPSAAKVALKWALISTATGIVFTFLWQFLGVNPTSPIVYIGFIPFIAFLFLAQKEYRDQLGGFIKFGDAFLAGFLFAVFAGIGSAIFSYIYYTLSPQAYQAILDAQRASMEAKGLSADQVDQAMDFTNKFGKLFTLIGALIGTPIIGAIIAVVGAAIFKKEPSLLDIEQRASESEA